jgi:hypothetical protein
MGSKTGFSDAVSESPQKLDSLGELNQFPKVVDPFRMAIHG